MGSALGPIILAVWLAVILVWLLRIWAWPRRKPDYLANRYAASASAARAAEGTFKATASAMTDVFYGMAYGSPSYKTWKLNCDASLRASQRRRGLLPDEED